jgi:hypothetical protein
MAYDNCQKYLEAQAGGKATATEIPGNSFVAILAMRGRLNLKRNYGTNGINGNYGKKRHPVFFPSIP